VRVGVTCLKNAQGGKNREEKVQGKSSSVTGVPDST